MTTLTADEREQLIRRAVTISLLTWRRAEPSDELDDDNREGWWGDSFPPVDNDRIGSRLWLLRRRSLTAQTLLDAQAYATEALQWIVDDKWAKSVSVTATKTDLNSMRLVTLFDEASSSPLRFTFDNIWQVINAV